MTFDQYFQALGFVIGVVLWFFVIRRLFRKSTGFIVYKKEVEPHTHEWYEIGLFLKSEGAKEMSMARVCLQCGFLAGQDRYVDDTMLTAIRAQKRHIEEVQDYRARVTADIVAKHFPAVDYLHDLKTLGTALALANECVEKGMTLTRDMAAEKLRNLAKDMRDGREQ